MTNSEILNALRNRAIGYESQEVTEEYQSSEEGEKMVKRKVVTKHVPPDVTAVKVLIDIENGGDITNLSDEELELEKQRLLSLIIRSENDSDKN